MSAFMIFVREGAVRDPEALAEYSRQNRENAQLFSSTYNLKPLVVYGAMETLEGEAPDGIVMLQFPSAEEAKAWYNSPQYQEALPHRMKGADYRAILVEGF